MYMSNLGGGVAGASGGVMVTDSLADGTLLIAGDNKTLTMRFSANGSVEVDVRGIGQDVDLFTYDGNVTVILVDAIEAGDNIIVRYEKA